MKIKEKQKTNKPISPPCPSSTLHGGTSMWRWDTSLITFNFNARKLSNGTKYHFKFHSTVYRLKQKNPKILGPTSFRIHIHFNQQISMNFPWLCSKFPSLYMTSKTSTHAWNVGIKLKKLPQWKCQKKIHSHLWFLYIWLVCLGINSQSIWW